MSGRINLPPYPRGWFAVDVSAALAPGEVKPCRYFGRDLVLFRTTAGEATLFDAHCPHLGAHLGHGGTVEGENLVCPFHGWSFGRDGACTGMPYGKRIPATATARAWSVREQSGVILAWHDLEGGDPDWEMPLFDDEELTEPMAMRRTIHGHPQEVMENSADFGHFRFIHQTHLVRAVGETRNEGPVLEFQIESDPEALVPELRLDQSVMEGLSICHGPGLSAATLVPKGSGLKALQRLYVTPIDEERIELRGLVSVGKLDDPAAAETFASTLTEAVFAQWDNDIPIWEHKVYREKPALNEVDSRIPEFRRWYSQFYTSPTG
ncbi:MAG: Rieske 2Fe-2S domain-containing protein [Myxococcales bacterium]|nr:Rieske 2Fe-2S domain-containing protein [Myxococcales bacterium]